MGDNCCKLCFVPEHDELRGPNYMIADAVPESCKDEECECHNKVHVHSGFGTSGCSCE